MTPKTPFSRASIVAGVSLVVWLLARSGVAVPPDIADAITEVLGVAAPLAWLAWESRHRKPGGDAPSDGGDPS